MPSRTKSGTHLHYRKDRSLWAKSGLTRGVMTGYREWYRKDGSKMRTGSFETGVQAGNWSTTVRNLSLVRETGTLRIYRR